MTRSTEEVFKSHLRERERGDLESDIRQNYAQDVVVMSNFGIFHGHGGVRQSVAILHQQLPSGRHYTFVQTLTDQSIAFEKWDGSSSRMQVKNGGDFFIIKDGLIQLQLIYYKPFTMSD